MPATSDGATLPFERNAEATSNLVRSWERLFAVPASSCVRRRAPAGRARRPGDAAAHCQEPANQLPETSVNAGSATTWTTRP